MATPQTSSMFNETFVAGVCIQGKGWELGRTCPASLPINLVVMKARNKELVMRRMKHWAFPACKTKVCEKYSNQNLETAFNLPFRKFSKLQQHRNFQTGQSVYSHAEP